MSAADAHGRADWHRVQQLYRQFIRTVDHGNLDEGLAGDLAKAMARTCAAYDGEEERFVWHLLEICDEVDPREGTREDRLRGLYSDARYNVFDEYLKKGVDDRRRPVPFEAAVETCRRLRDINRLRDQLAPVPTGCVLGGSVSYGRFFNTVGHRDNEPSDLDLLLVVEGADAVTGIVDGLRRLPSVRPEQLEHMAERAALYPALRADRGRDFRCMFSHRLNLWPPSAADPFLAGTGIDGSYALSIHVATVTEFDHLILRDLPRLDAERTMFDFRASPPPGPDLQRSFAGTQFEVERTTEEIDGGYLVSSQVCHVANAAPEKGSRYHPGQLQNLILPEIELRWDLDAHHLYLPLYSFKVKLDERLAVERVERPYEVQNLANSHTRRFAFAPYVASRVDGK